MILCYIFLKAKWKYKNFSISEIKNSPITVLSFSISTGNSDFAEAIEDITGVGKLKIYLDSPDYNQNSIGRKLYFSNILLL